ncbi:MAG: MoxR family ATPase, partial [Candidatus Omnitrophica bacterium]|nr:MoxR family ATPase [Candidatus Omnitrophota bacterium]
LPEAQLDRFMLQIDLGYPPRALEEQLIINRTTSDPVNQIDSVLGLDDLNRLRDLVDQIKIEASVSNYLMEIVEETRRNPQIRLGVSTRGALLYARMVRSRAIFYERDYVIPEDIKTLAVNVLSHRMLLDTKAQYGGVTREKIIHDILHSVKVPR